MKFLIFFSSLLFTSYGLSPEDAASIRTTLMKFGEKCKTEIGASPAVVNQLILGKNPTTTDGKCFLACMHKSIGFQDDNGKVNMSGVNGWVSRITGMDADLGGKMKRIADNCESTVNQGGEACDLAANIFECYTKLSKEYGISMLMR